MARSRRQESGPSGSSRIGAQATCLPSISLSSEVHLFMLITNMALWHCF